MLPSTSDVPGLQPFSTALPGVLAGVRTQYNYQPLLTGSSIEWAPSRQQTGASTSAAPRRQTPTAAGNAPRSHDPFGRNRIERPNINIARAFGVGSIGIGAGGAAVSAGQPRMRMVTMMGACHALGLPPSAPRAETLALVHRRSSAHLHTLRGFGFGPSPPGDLVSPWILGSAGCVTLLRGVAPPEGRARPA